MRILKSWVLLLLCFTIHQALAQDTAFSAGNKNAVFHADKATATVQLKERAVPDSMLQRLRKDETFWYANVNFKKQVNQAQPVSFWQWLFQQQWFYNFLWLLIIGSFIAVVFLFLLKSNIQLFHKAATPIDAIKDAEVSETIFSIDFDAALQKALAATDYRLAVRLQYLQLLALLSGKNHIQYKEDFTNSDYLQQLQTSTCYEPFKKLTLHFEYTWYGKFELTSATYQSIAADFNHFKNSMSL